MNPSQLDQVRVLISQGRRCQNTQSWKEARSCYLSAAELMLRMAEGSTNDAKLVWLNRAKSLRQVASKLETSPNASNGEKSPLLEQNNVNQSEPWLIVERPRLTFNDVAGFESVKEEIGLTLLYPFSHAEAADY